MVKIKRKLLLLLIERRLLHEINRLKKTTKKS